ncbi:MAG TPA: site-2 protease family protein [Candidatus Nanoarchaeia archaeon]|nr:site-2 protease family protein [Candidatus Nanoarchaeia archaeon]
MMNLDAVSIVIFVLLISAVVYINRKKIALQKIVFPFLYLILYRTSFGLRLMERIGRRHAALIRFFGYISAGVGFIGMILISYSILSAVLRFLLSPATVDTGFAVVLPGTTVPGIGHLSFWHWVISIFILAVIHEFCHGIMAEAYGIKVKNSGWAFLSVLIPIIPAAFVEPDEEQVRKQKDIVQYSIFAAGPIANIMLALVVLLFANLVMVPIEANITEPVGFSFDVQEGYPAAQAGITSGTVITKVNGETMTDATRFSGRMFYASAPDERMVLSSAEKDYEMVLAPHPDDSAKGYIGVQGIRNEVQVKPGYEPWKGTFFWFKDLVKWLFLLNLFVGLINLLPLGIVDGGRMLHVLLSQLFPQERANRIWGIVSFGFLALLLIGLAGTYLKPLFG